MEQEIVKTALLGTGNYPFEPKIFPTDIQESLTETKNREINYLNALTLYKAYLEAGVTLEQVENISEHIPLAPDEILPLCSEEMVDFLRLILLENEGSWISFFPNFIDIVLEEKVILPSKYFSKIEQPTEKTIEAFGEKAKWIHSLKEIVADKEIDYLSLKKAQRYKYFTDLVYKNNEEESIAFLEELFDASTPSERLRYMKVIEVKTEGAIKVIEFFDDYIKNNPSKSKNLKATQIKIKLNEKNSSLFESYYQEVFSKIWINKDKSYVLLEQEELDKLLKPLAFFTTTDETLEFILELTPIEYWLKMMDIKSKDFLEKVKNSKITYRKERFFEGWMRQAMKKRDEALLYELLALNVPIPHAGVINVFEEDKIFDFVEQYANYFVQEQISLIEMFKTDSTFHTEWTRSFSFAILKELIEGKTYYYKREWTKAIWTIAAYLHMDAMVWLEQKLKEPQCSSDFEDLEEHFGEIMKMKILFEKIKNNVKR